MALSTGPELPRDLDALFFSLDEILLEMKSKSPSVEHVEPLYSKMEHLLNQLKKKESGMSEAARRVHHDVFGVFAIFRLNIDLDRDLAVLIPALEAAVNKARDFFLKDGNELLLESLSLGPFLRSFHARYEMALRFTRPPIHFSLSLPSKDLHIRARRDWLEVALASMLKNAEKHAFPDDFEQRFERDAIVSVSVGFDDSMAYVRHRDNGVGIPADVLEKIFEDGFSGSDSSDGQGMGMTNVVDCVRLMGGQLSSSSVPGEGTIFSLGFPLLKSA